MRSSYLADPGPMENQEPKYGRIVQTGSGA